LISKDTAVKILNCTTLSNDMVTKVLPNYVSNYQPCSYAGWLPVPNTDNHPVQVFYWYFPHTSSVPDKLVPMIVYLSTGSAGKPYAASLSIFNGIGPFFYDTTTGSVSYIDEDTPQSWTYYYNVLFIDHPGGVGFSSPYFTDTSSWTEFEVIILSKKIKYRLRLHCIRHCKLLSSNIRKQKISIGITQEKIMLDDLHQLWPTTHFNSIQGTRVLKMTTQEVLALHR
jgi:Carboxypeptidase C (cathepsin A)